MSTKPAKGKARKRVAVAKKPTSTAVKKTASKNAARTVVPKKASNKKGPHKPPQKKTKKSFTPKATTPLSRITPTLDRAQLLVLAPLQMPLDIDRLAVTTARFGGLAMGVIGLMLTAFFANNIFFSSGPGSFAAALVCSDPNDTTTCVDETLTNSGQTTDPVQTVARIQDSTQAFDFNPNDPLKGTVRLRLSLDGIPKNVYVQAKNAVTTNVSEIGRASYKSGNTWEINFASTALPDGEYTFIAVAEYLDELNKAYLATISDTQKRSVNNTVKTDSVATETGSTQTTTAATSTTDTTTAPETQSGTALTTNTADTTDAGEVQTTTADETAPTSDTDAALTSNDALQAAAAETTDTTQEQIESQANPKIEVRVNASQPLSGTVPVEVRARESMYVELYARPLHSGTVSYLGQVTKVADDRGVFQWNTTKVPNASYELQAKVRTPYGIFTAVSAAVKVYNQTPVVVTDNDTIYREAVRLVEEDAEIDLSLADTTEDNEQETLTDEAEYEVNDLSAEVDSLEPEIEQQYQALVNQYRDKLEAVLQVLVAAIRSGDPEAESKARQRISELMKEIKDSVLLTEHKDTLIARIDQKINELVVRTEEDIRRANELISQRTGVAAETDTDGDGITDFDEITLFKTNPKVADSDGDGFTDGAEILGGFDPTDSTPEVAVAYESPKEVGVIREDLLEVRAITTENFGASDQSLQPVALIAGKGLPNSFVTLYIFSTPIVVTLKTEADGSWVYRFDRELEDGEHVIYAGITDNAGKIVAKSNPLTFVKEAQAFTQVDDSLAVAAANSDRDQTLFSLNMIYLVASISVVAIAVVLILLGLHLETTPRRTVVTGKETPNTV